MAPWAHRQILHSDSTTCRLIGVRALICAGKKSKQQICRFQAAPDRVPISTLHMLPGFSGSCPAGSSCSLADGS